MKAGFRNNAASTHWHGQRIRMAHPPRFRCPACGFAVFNRRLARCESCAVELPVAFRLTAREVTDIDADHARNEKARAEIKREADAHEAARARQRGNAGDGGVDSNGLDDIVDGLGGCE
jgi:hypothetical protein